MATITLGVGTSHSPQCSTPGELWDLHAQRDRANPILDFPELIRKAKPDLAQELSMSVWQQKDQDCQAAIAHLAMAIDKTQPDVLIVLGDDQNELFGDDNRGAFGIYWGDTMEDIPPPIESYHPSIRPSYWARHNPDGEIYPVASAMAKFLIEQLMVSEFDLSQSARQPKDGFLGHAFTFIRRRLTPNRVIPMIPIFINTYYPPNQPTVARCMSFGKALREAIDAYPEDINVCLIASGGLSHFVVDEEIDQHLLQAISTKDEHRLASIPNEKLISGTSEIRNWIATATALWDFQLEWQQYIPAYRSEAGTGMGMAFAIWEPPG